MLSAPGSDCLHCNISFLTVSRLGKQVPPSFQSVPGAFIQARSLCPSAIMALVELAIAGGPPPYQKGVWRSLCLGLEWRGLPGCSASGGRKPSQTLCWIPHACIPTQVGSGLPVGLGGAFTTVYLFRSSPYPPRSSMDSLLIVLSPITLEKPLHFFYSST